MLGSPDFDAAAVEQASGQVLQSLASSKGWCGMGRAWEGYSFKGTLVLFSFPPHVLHRFFSKMS